MASSLAARADLLTNNFWVNPFFEIGSNLDQTDGTVANWNRGGGDPTICQVITNNSVSPTHSLALIDANTNGSGYGEWYSDQLNITAGTNYQLRYNLRYTITNIGPMRVTVNFYDTANTLFSSVSYQFAGSHDFWEEMTQQFTAPSSAVKLNLSFTSGGGVNVTGQAWLDDISLATATNVSSLVPYIENFPLLPMISTPSNSAYCAPSSF